MLWGPTQGRVRNITRLPGAQQISAGEAVRPCKVGLRETTQISQLYAIFSLRKMKSLFQESGVTSEGLASTTPGSRLVIAGLFAGVR